MRAALAASDSAGIHLETVPDYNPVDFEYVGMNTAAAAPDAAVGTNTVAAADQAVGMNIVAAADPAVSMNTVAVDELDGYGCQQMMSRFADSVHQQNAIAEWEVVVEAAEVVAIFEGLEAVVSALAP